MFSQHRGNEQVRGGTYLCLTTGEFVSIAEQGGRLPGSGNSRYLKVNPIVALFVGPIAGLFFVIFLPLAVPLFVAWLVIRRIRGAAPAVAQQVADSLCGPATRAAYASSAALPLPTPQRPGRGGPERKGDQRALEEFLADIERKLDEEPKDS